MDDLHKVNMFSRMEIMKQKTRELTANVSAFVKPEHHDKFILLCDQFGHLAIDWVNGNDLEWQESLADKKASRIMDELSKQAVV